MTTRIMLFNDAGLHIGSISRMALSALIDSGLLDRDDTPVENLAPIHGPCIECGTHPCAIGIFCRCCFTRLQACDAAWAGEWYGLDWDEAVRVAQEVQG